MDVVLDECSLVADVQLSPRERIERLVGVLRALDQLGFARSLRTTRNAADLELAGGHGLRHWCFADGPTDSGRFLARRLDRQPYVDGPGGLETASLCQASVLGYVVRGICVAAVTGAALVALANAVAPCGQQISVVLEELGTDHCLHQRNVSLQRLVVPAEVATHRDMLQRAVDSELASGRDIIARSSELFPHMRMGPDAAKQIGDLTGSEPFFSQLVRHLRQLDTTADTTEAGQPFSPVGLQWSPESPATLDDGRLGPLRDFRCPDGFEARRWSLHTKPTGGAVRLYFCAEVVNGCYVFLVGYFGAHLRTRRYR